MEYLIINYTTRKILRRIRREPTAEELATARRKGLDIVPQVDLPDPQYDEATQNLSGYGAPVDEGARFTRARSVVELSAEQLESKDFRAKVAAAIAALTSGTGTAAQRLERVELTLAKILKDNYL